MTPFQWLTLANALLIVFLSTLLVHLILCHGGYRLTHENRRISYVTGVMLFGAPFALWAAWNPGEYVAGVFWLFPLTAAAASWLGDQYDAWVARRQREQEEAERNRTLVRVVKGDDHAV